MFNEIINFFYLKNFLNMLEIIFFAIKFNIKIINKILLIYYLCLFSSLSCKIIIPFKYISSENLGNGTPKEIMNYYLKERINIKLELGTPQQETEIPIGFTESDIYIVEKDKLREPHIKNKIFEKEKSSSFNFLDEEIQYFSNNDYSMFQRTKEIFHF